MRLFCLHAEFVLMLLSFTWLSDDLLKDNPPSKFLPLKFACSVKSTKTQEASFSSPEPVVSWSRGRETRGSGSSR